MKVSQQKILKIATSYLFKHQVNAFGDRIQIAQKMCMYKYNICSMDSQTNQKPYYYVVVLWS